MKRRIFLYSILFLAALITIGVVSLRSQPDPSHDPLCADSLGLILEESEAGLHILAVRNHSRANHAGMYPGDILTAVNGVPLSELSLLDELLSQLDPPCSITCQVMRNDEPITLQMKITDRARRFPL